MNTPNKPFALSLTAQEVHEALLSVNNKIDKSNIAFNFLEPSNDTVPSTQAVLNALDVVSGDFSSLGALSQEDNIDLNTDKAVGVLPISKGGTGTSTAAAARQALDVLTPSEIDKRINNAIPEIQEVDLQGDKIINELPISRGGTAASSVGQARQNLGVDSSVRVTEKIAEETWDGYLVGYFEYGFEYTSSEQVARDSSNGKYYKYIGQSAFPVEVPAGTIASQNTSSYQEVKNIGYTIKDNDGFKQALLSEAGITPNGLPDSKESSQSLNALKTVARKPLELKIFQSPTDNLTKVSTLSGGVGVVYEVRKTPDNSLATIYSDKDGTTVITQNGTDNVSNSEAESVFYIADGYYYAVIEGVATTFSVSNKKSKLISFKSIEEAVNSPLIKDGDTLILKERDINRGGGGTWDCILTSSVTPNNIDIIQSDELPLLSLRYRKEGIVDALSLGAFPNAVATDSEDVSPNILRASEISGNEAVLLEAGGYNTGEEEFNGLNFVSFGNARSYQTATLRAVDLSQSRNDKPIGNSIIDMHYSILRGTGARTGEAQSGGVAGSSDLSFNVSAQAPVGSKTIVLTSSGALIAGQLIAYEGSNGEFYTAKIESINSGVLSLGEELEATIDIGDNVYAFYRNDYHPSDTGYKAIADHSLREMRTKRTVLERADLTQRGTGTITPITVNDQSNPGSYRPVTPEAEVLSYDITSPGTSISANGAQAVFSPKMAGQYEIHVVVNTQGQDVGLSWFSDGGYSRSITVNNDSPTLYRFPAFVYGGSGSLTLTLGTPIDGGEFKAKASVHLVYVENRDFNVNRGTHVCMGDSWFFEGPLVDRLKERLPNAVIFNKGVGGEKAADINARFEADVTPLKPDFVWFMSGTNDWFGFVDPILFAYQLGQFKSYCKEIGATCLMFTGSVAPDATLVDQWSWSRAYQEFSYYEDELIEEDKTLTPTITINVPAGVPVQLGRYGDGNALEIIEHYLNSDCNVIESSSLVGNENQTILPTGFNAGANVTINPSTAKFIRLESANAGYLIIKGNPST